MKVYRDGDPIAPIAVKLATHDDVNGLSPWIIGPGLILFAIAMWVHYLGEGGFQSRMIVFGFGLALMFGGVATISGRVPALRRFGARHPLAIVVTLIWIVLMTFGPVAVLAFVPGSRPVGAIFLAGFVIHGAGIPLWLLVRRNARRIAGEMHKAGTSSMVHPETPIAIAHATPATPANPGELSIAVYETNDLPVAGPFRSGLTADANIVGRLPCRFLYLYNFFADAINDKPRPTAGWRLHGPVTMLASPLDLARLAGYHIDAAHEVESLLLTDEMTIKTRVAAMTYEPLAPKSPGLPKLFADFGAYPEEVLHCTDGTWQAGVGALTARAEKVIIDAADFSPERRGLAWEIQHVLNHFAVQDIVVLVNSFTDLPALGLEFRRAWRTMATTSPNNRPSEVRLRIVLLIGDDQGGFDGGEAPGARDGAVRDRERLVAHDRIVMLLREE